jgi:membrane protein
VATSSLVDDARVVAATGRGAAQIKQFLQQANSGTLGTVGGLFLFWTAIMMLIRMEETFNDIWGVTQGRDWWPRITNYFFVIVFGPVLLITAIGLAGGSHFQKTRNLLGLMPFFEPVVSQLLPVAMISMTFALFYKLMPNTKVRFSAAFVGGLLAGTAWHIFNLLSLHLGSSAMNASKIYGGLALVPLLMVGLYVVWVIVLFGAQVAYAFQNRESYLQERLAENVNQRGREFVALRLMTCIGQHFQHSWPPATVPQMSRELGIPSKLIQQVLQTLLAARLVVEVHGAESGYAPARPLETINCHHILLAMRATQGQELVTRDEPVRAEVIGEFARIQAAEKAAASTVTMLALVNRAQARLDLVALTGPESESQSLPAQAEVRPPVELPGEKPLGEPLPEVNFAEPIEPVEPVPPKEKTPVSPVNIPAGAPSAASATTDDNQSFPL